MAAGEKRRRSVPTLRSKATPQRLRHYLWLAEDLMKPGVAELFEEALPDDVRAVCNERIADLEELAKREAEEGS